MVPTYLVVSKMRFMHSIAFPKTSAYWNPDALRGYLSPWYHRLHAYILGTAFRLFSFLWLLWTKWKKTSRPGGMTARTRFLDESIRSAVADGAKQVVILGAGLDTHPGRLREVLEGVRVFKVDLPSSQAVKRAALQRAGLVDDWGAEFVPIDFRDEHWPDTLRQAGCDLGGVRTHVLWEGVLYYLAEERIATTLRALRQPGVSLSFDMVSKECTGGDDANDPAARQWKRLARSVGEPMLTGLDFGRIREWATSHGWEVTDALCSPTDISDRFFPNLEPGTEPYTYCRLASMRPAIS